MQLCQYLGYEPVTLSGIISGWQNDDCADQTRIGLLQDYFSNSSFAKFTALTCECYPPYTPPLPNVKGLH